jgi:hypothetical protein
MRPRPHLSPLLSGDRGVVSKEANELVSPGPLPILGRLSDGPKRRSDPVGDVSVT